jgi:hypothetical protein
MRAFFAFPQTRQDPAPLPGARLRFLPVRFGFITSARLCMRQNG